ncbi:uncharacterized protein EKO05_0006319 [Ascochyta rabiei]|uniref:uncharacterized protein n=1 Tax=Didymella rabiei TaxID=5454 RepID=UPI002208CF72|nr:uncharacterized protein EKO05_0006319 [Ascochyta rabiei]UPX15886.1 hypothetical protein EKO05_0006319 [Ascochyta rabiei]
MHRGSRAGGSARDAGVGWWWCRGDLQRCRRRLGEARTPVSVAGSVICRALTAHCSRHAARCPLLAATGTNGETRLTSRKLTQRLRQCSFLASWRSFDAWRCPSSGGWALTLGSLGASTAWRASRANTRTFPLNFSPLPPFSADNAQHRVSCRTLHTAHHAPSRFVCRRPLAALELRVGLPLTTRSVTIWAIDSMLVSRAPSQLA